jgi:protein-L-isoaspartate(D-aspartate) O-methyltransferase
LVSELNSRIYVAQREICFWPAYAARQPDPLGCNQLKLRAYIEHEKRESMQAWHSKVSFWARIALLAAVLLVVALLWPEGASKEHSESAYADARESMLELIEADVRRTSEYLGKTALDPKVMDAIGRVPRHEFVPEALRAQAYENHPLPIGHDQTISQPYIVAIMTDLLELPAGCKALDIGTGSGYQAAILAEICDEVFSIEIVEPLGLAAEARLKRLGYDNVTVRIGDGFNGWAEQEPFDAIVVAATADRLPPPLVAQLKPGARMIIPVRQGSGSQELVLVEKHVDEKIITRDILPVLFVPLTGDHD